jgi:hypothetical protein
MCSAMMSPDGERFLMLTEVGSEDAVSTPISVVLNWPSAIRR